MARKATRRLTNENGTNGAKLISHGRRRRYTPALMKFYFSFAERFDVAATRAENNRAAEPSRAVVRMKVLGGLREEDQLLRGRMLVCTECPIRDGTRGGYDTGEILRLTISAST